MTDDFPDPASPRPGSASNTALPLSLSDLCEAYGEETGEVLSELHRRDSASASRAKGIWHRVECRKTDRAAARGRRTPP